jgi:hypothetical protein
MDKGFSGFSEHQRYIFQKVLQKEKKERTEESS